MTESRARFLQPSRVRVVFLLVAVLVFFLTEFGRHVYRPYQRRLGFADLGLADSIGNLGGIVVQIFVMLAVMNPTRRRSLLIAPLLAVGYIVYEFLQPVLPRGVFDWRDVYATGLGLGVALAILWAAWRAFPETADGSGDRRPPAGPAG